MNTMSGGVPLSVKARIQAKYLAQWVPCKASSGP